MSLTINESEENRQENNLIDLKNKFDQGLIPQSTYNQLCYQLVLLELVNKREITEEQYHDIKNAYKGANGREETTESERASVEKTTASVSQCGEYYNIRESQAGGNKDQESCKSPDKERDIFFHRDVYRWIIDRLRRFGTVKIPTKTVTKNKEE
eukprot:TRINITY_DN491_c0_g1_i2.p1 TRINITY_DN491_c0_g1~~TRINITY_DN491_c0_g1_i2.p1  ORF type:complete len:154 (-),score=10.62 TRINITY_DN491_c0_g1_i2:583-1044(-)